MLSASQSAPPTFPDMDWTCIKTQPQYTALVPKCAQYCHANGLQNNDCPIDDFICHCKNFWGTASLIEPCSDDPALYQCTQEETLYFVGLAGSFCEFWNATADAAQEAVKRKCGKDCKPSSTKYKSVGTGTPKW
ncbi:hypothetical protein P152DRAFT_477414 [Eremomyces bilateralis CBS 781.70]|uniref:CFEM domain-containing protein n=1 Tax=Eremomyces bilateralis CBS 781.70 TaxID=1392243 RepID=A0A6G1FRG3_9PEZI|nr:uncharacterized protein P152DRAFT_477414 [Eremomyces bilateralis CBS 781.70]KAF1808384.1 hypothetical protein P152DRAFT_477414 [Eremomyces bilateralis CBS 781.70]